MPDPFVQGLRLTVFGENQRWSDPGIVLRAVFGREADVSERKAPLQFALARANGQPRGWQVTAQSLPGRLDLLQEAALEPVQVGRVSARMQPSPEVLAQFVERANTHAADVIGAEAKRIALGSTLRWKVSSPAEAIASLKSWHAHLDLRPDDTDVVFQRNRPAEIQVAGQTLRINCVEQWSMVTFSVMVANFDREVSRQYCVQLTTDVNTAQEHSSPLPTGDIPAILGELASSTRTIFERARQ